MAKKSKNKANIIPGTKINFIGGVNKDRIGGNSMVIEHTNEAGNVTRALFDVGSMFTPYESGFTAAYPNLDDYLDRVDPKSGKVTKAIYPVDVLCLTHAHEDHIGGLVAYTKMGYQLPPIKASRFTRNLIRLAFAAQAMEAPYIEKVEPGDNFRIDKDMLIEPFTVSHSTIDSVGFHTLTFVDDKPYAGIVNNGDFLTVEDMPVGKSFSLADYEDLMQRKLTTNILIDSTSTIPNGKDRIGFDKAIDNTYQAVVNNADRNVIISPVISRSVQNMAIDIETARKLETKIFLDGKWLELVAKAMKMSGYANYDDVLYKGTIDQYLNDKAVRKKYIVCTGAFAQGLREYENNQSNFCDNIPMASATKMALGLHPTMKIGNHTLVLARQRIIDEINGDTGPKMLQKMAALGAKVVMTPSGRKIGNFEEIQMQDSGHVNAKALGQMIDAVAKNAPEAIYTPIHGNPDQCDNTKSIIEAHGGKVVIVENQDGMAVGKGKAKLLDEKQPPLTWYAVKQIAFDPLHPDMSIPPEGRLEYWRVDENYMPLEKIIEVDNVRRSPAPRYGQGTDYISTGEMFEDTVENMPVRESNKESKFNSKVGKKQRRKEAIAKQVEMYRQHHGKESKIADDPRFKKTLRDKRSNSL